MIDHYQPIRILAVTNMYPTGERPAEGAFVAQQIEGLRRIGIDVRLLYVPRARAGMMSYCGLGRSVRQERRSTQADVIHVMYGGVMADLVTQAVRDFPVTVSFCGSDLLGERHSGLTRRLLAACGVWASHRAARRAPGVIVKSQNLFRALPVGLARSKVDLIPNGVDLGRFCPLDRDTCRAALGWNGGVFHVLFPANAANTVKRFDLARAALDELAHQGYNVELHELKGLAHEQVPVWLNAVDVVLLTSIHEGSPNIVKEALACDLPVVSVDVGDVAERIAGIDGCYLALPDPTDLAAKLRLVHTGPRRVSARTKMSDLSLERVADRHLRHYQELLNTWRPNP